MKLSMKFKKIFETANKAKFRCSMSKKKYIQRLKDAIKKGLNSNNSYEIGFTAGAIDEMAFVLQWYFGLTKQETDAIIEQAVKDAEMHKMR